MPTPIIDIHCHTFNADDLPVTGFIRRVSMRGKPFGATLASLAEAAQIAAPGYKQERAKLDALLGREGIRETYGLEMAEEPESIAERFDAEAEETLDRLKVENHALLKRAATELQVAESYGGDHPGPEGFSDWMSTARRLVRWLTLFGRSRFDVTRLLVENFHSRVNLFCPLLVDLGTGLGDSAETTIREQVVLQEKISRLSVLGRWPGDTHVRIHPFAAFDPRREVRARLVGDIDTPFSWVKQAVEHYGFIGVKVYPPMGWKPIGNTVALGMSATEAAQVDKVLIDLYKWCEKAHVPITAHCNMSNHADDSYRDFASPDNWLLVLEKFPKLHLNLGHFGGTSAAGDANGWPWQIARAVAEYEYLFADVGNHNIYDTQLAKEYLDHLRHMYESPETAEMRNRLMFGSDWYMVAIHPEHDAFLEDYESLYREYFDVEATAAFLGGSALRFLGFDDPNNQNAKRLADRYDAMNAALPGWLAHA